MGQDRLNSLALLSIERDMSSRIDSSEEASEACTSCNMVKRTEIMSDM